MRTKRRSKWQSVVVVGATVLFAFVATMLALTRSTTEIQPQSAASPVNLVPPENETAELAAAANQATPDELMDLKRSSGDEITIDMVRRQQAQAEAVPAAANPPGGGLTYFGDGIYKSTDNGVTWQHMGLPDSAAFGRIAVDPTNSNRVFVAAAGHIARSVSQRGVYRTEDAGKTW